MNKIKLVIATIVAIGSFGLASSQAVNALSSPRASDDRLPVKKESCHMANKQGCAKEKSAACGKAEKACGKKAESACCKKK